MDNQISKAELVLASLLTPLYSGLVYDNYDFILSVDMNGENENKLLDVLKNGLKAIDPQSFKRNEGTNEIALFVKNISENYPDKKFIKKLEKISQSNQSLYNDFQDNLSYVKNLGNKSWETEKTMADMWEYELDVYYKDNSPLKAVTNY